VKRLPVVTRPKFDPDGTSYEIDQRVKAIVQESLSVYRVDGEMLRALEPDVIVTQAHCEVCAVSLREVERTVCAWLRTCPQLVSLSPNALADVWEDIERVAVELGALDRGRELVGRLQKQTNAISQRAKTLAARPTVACIEWLEPLMAAGNWMPELVELAGGVNLFGEAGKHSPWMTWEQLVVADPAITLKSLVDSSKQRSAGVKRMVQPRSPNQRKYVEAIEQCDMTFGLGPAGTGKTYLAVAMAVSALMAKKVSRIILVRPAVEAGERLGFLPGSLQEKVDPYLRPLYDALYDLLDPVKVDKMLESNVIEVAPLAFMRGRTLNDAFIIMDEAQNTTTEQMKMFVTRLGANSKAVITGDLTQIDLPNPKKSGLLEALHVLDGVEGIRFCHFEDVDVVRHHLVQRIVRAYDSYGKAQQQLPLALSDTVPDTTLPAPIQPIPKTQ